MEVAILFNLSPAESQWLNFGAMALAILIGAGVVFYFSTTHRTKRKRKRRHQGHGRINPTRAEIGGLPPPRSPREHEESGDRPSPFDP